MRGEDLTVEVLSKLPPRSFGYQYAQWMGEKDFSAEERPIVKYVPDLELAYIMQRYREVNLHSNKRFMISFMSSWATGSLSQKN